MSRRVLAGLLVVVASTARADEELPSFWLLHTARGQADKVWYASHVEARYELCDDWPQPKPSPGSPPGQKASRSRALFTFARSLLALRVGTRLSFCRVSGSGGGQDSDGSQVNMVILPDGRERNSGVEVTPGSPPSRKKFDFEDDPADNEHPLSSPAAELVRTASGAKLIVPPSDEPNAGGYGYFGAANYYALDKTPAQHAAWSTFELTEQDLRTFSDLVRTKTISLSSRDQGTFSGTVTVQAKLPELGEVRVEVEDYENWRPKGNLEKPAEAGDHLKIKARVHEPGAPDKPSDKKVKLTFELKGVSSVKGVCNNAPLEGADFQPDLRFLPERNPKFEVSEAKATTKDLVNEVELVVSSFDFGAFGGLAVKAVDSKGRDVPVTLKGREGKKGAALPIPQDDDENEIADSWQRKWGVFGRSRADDDETVPFGNGFAGDGLTLYEEYRGFMVVGGWRDTDPKKKDLFISDRSGVAGPGIARFETASELKVHLVTGLELGKSRVINRHVRPGAHAVDQHGLLIESGAGSPVNLGDRFGPPRTSEKILVPAAPTGKNHAQQEFISDVAHEIGHGVGLKHHGDGPMYAVIYRWKQVGADWVLMGNCLAGDSDTPLDELKQTDCKTFQVRLVRESDGAALKKGDPMPEGFVWSETLKGWVGYEVDAHAETSGDDTCLMRYAEKGVYISKAEPATLRYVPDDPEWHARTTLCSGKAGTGVNAPGRKPQSRYGDAARGNCRGQLVVNDGAP